MFKLIERKNVWLTVLFVDVMYIFGTSKARHFIVDTRVGHGSDPSAGRVGSGRVVSGSGRIQILGNTVGA